MDLFSAEERETLRAVLDAIIPPSADGRMPGAGALGLAAHVERGLAPMAMLVPAIQQGLAALEAIAREQGAADFPSLPAAKRNDALGALAAAQPAFLGPLLFHTYANYYQQPQVILGIGLEARPPFPKGHTLAPFDERLLDRVRSGPKRYRDC
jgi:hypothetical protein